MSYNCFNISTNLKIINYLPGILVFRKLQNDAHEVHCKSQHVFKSFCWTLLIGLFYDCFVYNESHDLCSKPPLVYLMSYPEHQTNCTSVSVAVAQVCSKVFCVCLKLVNLGCCYVVAGIHVTYWILLGWPRYKRHWC